MSDEEELKKAIGLVLGQKPEIFTDQKIMQKELSEINNLYYRINIFLIHIPHYLQFLYIIYYHHYML